MEKFLLSLVHLTFYLSEVNPRYLYCSVKNVLSLTRGPQSTGLHSNTANINYQTVTQFSSLVSTNRFSSFPTSWTRWGHLLLHLLDGLLNWANSRALKPHWSKQLGETWSLWLSLWHMAESFRLNFLGSLGNIFPKVTFGNRWKTHRFEDSSLSPEQGFLTKDYFGLICLRIHIPNHCMHVTFLCSKLCIKWAVNEAIYTSLFSHLRNCKNDSHPAFNYAPL